METDREEEDEHEGEGGENDADDDDPRSSDEDGRLSPVAMTTEAGLTEKSREDGDFASEQKEESPQEQRQDGKGSAWVSFMFSENILSYSSYSYSLRGFRYCHVTTTDFNVFYW